MKKIILSVLALSSFSVMAIEPVKLTFTTDNTLGSVCKLTSSSEDSANLAFIGESYSVNNTAQFVIESSLINNIHTQVSGNWNDTSAWGGNVPESVVKSESTNKLNYLINEYENQISFEEDTPAGGSIDLRTVFSYVAFVEKPTNVGKGELNLTVQIECE